MDIFIINQDNPHAKSLAKKMSEQAQHNATILMTKEEMDLIASDDFQCLSLADTPANQDITQVYPGESYIFTAYTDTCHADIDLAASRLGLDYSVIRINDKKQNYTHKWESSFSMGAN